MLTARSVLHLRIAGVCAAAANDQGNSSGCKRDQEAAAILLIGEAEPEGPSRTARCQAQHSHLIWYMTLSLLTIKG